MILWIVLCLALAAFFLRQESREKYVQAVVLKGLAAAIYYPKPLRRAMGDIDVIVRPEDFAAAYHAFQSYGYITVDPLTGNDRHVHFKRNGITIELHKGVCAMEVMTTRQFAESQQVTYEAIRKQLIRYREELEGHIIQKGRTKYLDEYISSMEAINENVCCYDLQAVALQLK